MGPRQAAFVFVIFFFRFNGTEQSAQHVSTISCSANLTTKQQKKPMLIQNKEFLREFNKFKVWGGIFNFAWKNSQREKTAKPKWKRFLERLRLSQCKCAAIIFYSHNGFGEGKGLNWSERIVKNFISRNSRVAIKIKSRIFRILIKIDVRADLRSEQLYYVLREKLEGVDFLRKRRIEPNWQTRAFLLLSLADACSEAKIWGTFV